MISVLEILAEHGKESGNFKIEWTPKLGWQVECGAKFLVFQGTYDIETVIREALLFMLKSSKPIEPPAEVRAETGDSY